MTVTTPIGREDGVIVHRFLLFRNEHDVWRALGDDGVMLSAKGEDNILTAIARAAGSDDDLQNLRRQLARAIETGKRRRNEDALYEAYKARQPGRR